MNSNWIYVGADLNNHQWSKVGKTTRGPHSRHTSSQRPGYFIYTAYEIIRGDVHEIESNLLAHLESQPEMTREIHFSTGNKSECFLAHPEDIASLVENFIKDNYASCVQHEFLFDGICRFECDPQVYKIFTQNHGLSTKATPWDKEPQIPFPKHLNISARDYFTSNRVEHETDLGGGFFVDHATGLQGFRDEEGNEYFDEPK